MEDTTKATGQFNIKKTDFPVSSTMAYRCRALRRLLNRLMTMSLQSVKVAASQGEIFMPAATEAKRETLNIRIKPEVRDLIDRAARSRGKNRTDFILDSARLAAEDTLLDQVIMTASGSAFEQFQARLDMPPKPNARLRKTMVAPAPWERG